MKVATKINNQKNEYIISNENYMLLHFEKKI